MQPTTSKKKELDQLFHIGYVSTESSTLSEDNLIAILEEARISNERSDITGLLLYREGSFYQVLEGTNSAVTTTFEAIKDDQRHKDVRVLFEEDTDTREFPDWRMGFLNLNNADLEMISGFSDFLRRDAAPREFLENLGRGRRLALMFRTML